MITTLKVREDNRKRAQDIYDRWNEFVECFFVRKESYIASHSGEIFTRQRVERVLELFDENTEGEGFDDRLEMQFAEATVEEKLIFLHAEWIYFLMTHTENTRREKLSRWGDEIKGEVLLEIIISPGTHFNIRKYFLVRLILELFRDIYAEASGHNKWIEQYCLDKQSKKHLYGICSALLYIVNPDDYEPIVSKKDKKKIAKYDDYENLLDSVDDSVDKNIFNIRQALTKKYGEQHFSFYHERSEWQEQGSEQSQDGVEDQKGKYVPSNDEGQMHPLNQILYGPPGTGKTWNTVNYALAIIEGKSVGDIEAEVEAEIKEKGERDAVKQRFDELKDAGQIEMVTFHQNFTYEDFIEGIRPILDDDSGDESSNLQYEIVDGVFKKIADNAMKI